MRRHPHTHQRPSRCHRIRHCGRRGNSSVSGPGQKRSSVSARLREFPPPDSRAWDSRPPPHRQYERSLDPTPAAAWPQKSSPLPRVKSIRPQAIDRLGRQRHQAAGAQNLRRLVQLPRASFGGIQPRGSTSVAGSSLLYCRRFRPLRVSLATHCRILAEPMADRDRNQISRRRTSPASRHGFKTAGFQLSNAAQLREQCALRHAGPQNARPH